MGKLPCFCRGKRRVAFGGKMAMGSVSNIERESKMVFALRGKQRQALLGGYMVKGLKKA